MRSMLKQLITMQGMLTTTFLILLTSAAYIDFKRKRIPDRIVFCIFFVAFTGLFFMETPVIAQKAAGIFVVSVPMLLAALCAPGAFGGGDIKFMAACGLFLGAEAVFYSFFYSLILGGIYSVYLVLYKNKAGKTEFAFGPFLASGIILRLIFQGF